LFWDDLPVEVVTLWRPTGPVELALVEATGWRSWPPRLPDQPIFYPVLNRDYATRIARDWNVKHDGSGYVTRFDVAKNFLDKYEVHQVGGETILEYWIPAEDLPEFNANIVGVIQLVSEHHQATSRCCPHADPSACECVDAIGGYERAEPDRTA
jgi:hypothetical protein